MINQARVCLFGFFDTLSHVEVISKQQKMNEFFCILNCYLNSAFDFVKGISMKEIQQVMENMQTRQNAKAKAMKITIHIG